MHRIGRWIVAPRLGFALAGAGALLVAGSGAAQATQALYGPPPPPVSVPGGYLTVVTSQTCGTAGQTIGPVSVGNTETTVVIPAADCTPPLQVTITEPDVGAIGNAGICGYNAVAGVGIIIQNPSNGSINYSVFKAPIVVTITSPSIKRGDVIAVWNGYKFVKAGVASQNGTAIVKIDHAGYNFLAILAPVSGIDPCGSSQQGFGGGVGATGLSSGALDPGVFSSAGTTEAFFAGLLGHPAGLLPGFGVLGGRFMSLQPAHVFSAAFRGA